MRSLFGAALAQQHGGQQHHRAGHRHVDVEDPRPAQRIGQRTADEQRRRRAHAAHARPDAQRLVALGALGESGHEDGERRGRHHRRGHALQHARHDQRLRRSGQPAAQRGQQEKAGAQHEQAPPPQQVGHAPTEQQQAAEAQQVGAHDPRHAAGREAQRPLDGRQRQDDDLRIEDHHEVGRAQHGQRFPAAGIGRGLKWGVESVVHAHWSNGAGPNRHRRSEILRRHPLFLRGF
jgi:hypothetical protein